jgi:hypothetical protein
MEIAPFQTEQFFARYEFNTPWQLCNSDCETVSVAELLDLAGVPLGRLGRQRLSYSESRGATELREAIASGYRTVQPDEAVVLGAPVEGIYLLARALIEPGDEVVVLTPAYDALVNLFEHVAGTDRVRRWRLRPSGGTWTLDLDELRSLLTPATRLLVVNFPHNPTGYLPTPDWQRQLVALTEEFGLTLFADARQRRGALRPVQDPRLARAALRLAGCARPRPAGPPDELEVLHQHLRAGIDRIPGRGGAQGARHAHPAQPRTHRTEPGGCGRLFRPLA